MLGPVWCRQYSKSKPKSREANGAQAMSYHLSQLQGLIEIMWGEFQTFQWPHMHTCQRVTKWQYSHLKSLLIFFRLFGNVLWFSSYKTHTFLVDIYGFYNFSFHWEWVFFCHENEFSFVTSYIVTFLYILPITILAYNTIG